MLVKNSDIIVGDLVLLRKSKQPSTLSSKLPSPTAGPYPVIARKHDTFWIRTKRGDHWFKSGEVTRAPFPDDLADGVDSVDGVRDEVEEAVEGEALSGVGEEFVPW